MIPNKSRSEFLPILWIFLKCKKQLFEILVPKVFFLPFRPCPSICIHLIGLKFPHMIVYTLLTYWRMIRHLVSLSKKLITQRWGCQKAPPSSLSPDYIKMLSKCSVPALAPRLVSGARREILTHALRERHAKCRNLWKKIFFKL